MGPKNCEAEDPVLYTADGEKVGKIQDLTEVTEQAGKETASAMCPAMEELSVTISAKLEKSWYCQGRKRFIKPGTEQKLQHYDNPEDFPASWCVGVISTLEKSLYGLLRYDPRRLLWRMDAYVEFMKRICLQFPA